MVSIQRGINKDRFDENRNIEGNPRNCANFLHLIGEKYEKKRPMHDSRTRPFSCQSIENDFAKLKDAGRRPATTNAPNPPLGIRSLGQMVFATPIRTAITKVL